MSNPSIGVERLASLRLRATSRLRLIPDTMGAPVGATDALRVLFELASSPDTAGAALALLHELQVHQVELDLQAEELRESRTELESALRRQIELYDFQPVGYFSIDRSLDVHELNLSGARMLGLGRDEMYGLSLASFLAPDSGDTLRHLVSSVMEGRSCGGSTLQLIPKSGAAREVRAHISADPAGLRCLLVLCGDTAQVPAPPPDAAE